MAELILRLDVTGRPLDWISKRTAALMYVREQVAWEAGISTFRLLGGQSRLTGNQSFLDVNSIIAGRGIALLGSWEECTPSLNNEALFRRDNHICMYCGLSFSNQMLTRDHVHPRSRGGADNWENVVTACKPCNARKDNMTIDEAETQNIRLLAVPYRPNLAEALILQNRNILVDQMEFLNIRKPKRIKPRTL